MFSHQDRDRDRKEDGGGDGTEMKSKSRSQPSGLNRVKNLSRKLSAKSRLVFEGFSGGQGKSKTAILKFCDG